MKSNNRDDDSIIRDVTRAVKFAKDLLKEMNTTHVVDNLIMSVIIFTETMRLFQEDNLKSYNESCDCGIDHLKVAKDIEFIIISIDKFYKKYFKFELKDLHKIEEKITYH
jgi:hypothetical protein